MKLPLCDPSWSLDYEIEQDLIFLRSDDHEIHVVELFLLRTSDSDLGWKEQVDLVSRRLEIQFERLDLLEIKRDTLHLLDDLGDHFVDRRVDEAAIELLFATSHL